MRLLFLGDVMGRSGRAAVAAHLPRLRAEWALDFVVVNGENASGGMGLTGAHAADLLAAGADCLTLGDHAFDQKDMLAYVETEPRVLRPLNFAKGAPGRGARMFDAPGGRKVLVAQVLGQVFMRRPFDDPFSAIDAALEIIQNGRRLLHVALQAGNVHAELHIEICNGINRHQSRSLNCMNPALILSATVSASSPFKRLFSISK